MPHIAPMTPPSRFVTLLVDGEAVLGTAARQRVQLDTSIIKQVSEHYADADVSGRRRAMLNAMLAVCEAQLVDASGEPLRTSLSCDDVDVMVHDANVGDFVPLLIDKEPLIGLDRIRLLPRIRSRPGSRPWSARRPDGGVPSSASPPNASVALLARCVSLLRAFGEDPLGVDTEVVRTALSGGVDDAESIAAVQASLRAEGDATDAPPAVVDLLVNSFATGRTQAGGLPPNPLAARLEESEKRCAALAQQLEEQHNLMQLLQAALMDAKLIVQSLKPSPVPQGEGFSEAKPHSNPQVHTPPSGSQTQRITIFYVGCSTNGVDPCEQGCTLKRSRVVQLRQGEEPSLELLEQEALHAFGHALVRPTGPLIPPLVEPRHERLLPGYRRKGMSAVQVPCRFRDDAHLREYINAQTASMDPTQPSVPVIQVFAESAFADDPAATSCNHHHSECNVLSPHPPPPLLSQPQSPPFCAVSLSCFDEATIRRAYDAILEMQGHPRDGLLDVGYVLRYLRQSFLSLGDADRFTRLLPIRCAPAAQRRPTSARRAGDVLPATRMTYEEFALVMLRVAKS